MQSELQWSRWLYLIPIIFLLIIWGNYFSESSYINKYKRDVDINTYPLMSADELFRSIDLWFKDLDDSPPKNPNEYFKKLTEKEILRFAATRLNESGKLGSRSTTKMNAHLGRLLGFRNTLIKHLHKIDKKFSEEEIDIARELYFTSVLSKYEPSKDIVVERKFTFFLAYIFTGIFVAVIFFIIRLQRMGLSVWIEFYRIITWALIWPLGIFKYPIGIDIKRQLKDYARFMSGLFSILLSLFGTQVVHAKTKTVKNKTDETVSVSIFKPIKVSFSNPPLPQVLPTLNISKIKTNIYGWIHATSDSSNGLDRFKLTDARVRGTVAFEETKLFFQGNLRDGFGNLAVNQLWFSYTFDSGVRVKAGRLFLNAAKSTIPPFKRETITSPGIPTKFFASGLSVDSPLNEDWSFALDVTGDSRATIFSSNQFTRLQFSGSIIRKTQNGFIRLSTQLAGKLLTVLDLEHTHGQHTIRGAMHHQHENNMSGGYLLYLNKISSWLSLFGQFRYTNNKHLSLVGTRIQMNPNLTLKGEVRTDRSTGLQIQYHF